MPWVRLDDSFATNPKVIEAGPLALAMQVAGLCYSNKHLTDGKIPRPAAATLLDFTGLGMHMWQGEIIGGGKDAEWALVVDDLLDAGMWHEPDHDCPDCPQIDRGYVIHDYLEFQPSREQVLAEREQKREAGRKGGKAAARARAKASGQAGATAGAQAERQAESKPVPVPVPVPQDAYSSGLVENGKGGVRGGAAEFQRTLTEVAYEHADRRIAEGYQAESRDAFAHHLKRTDQAVENEALKRTPAVTSVRELLDGITKPIGEATG